LRKGWAVVSGQEVDILATGKGFQIRSKGKALGSAAAGQPLRIATRSGQIMTGEVDPQGYVKINLKE
jgi:flagella basal body P-ring formation protein FlgA